MHSYKFLFLRKEQSLTLIQIKQTWYHWTPYEFLYLKCMVDLTRVLICASHTGLHCDILLIT